MRMAVLQHVPFEGPAAIADWAQARSVRMRVSQLYEDAPLPSLDAFDILTIMGGPMGANDEARFTWMAAELNLIHEAIHVGKAVLGVCLGAQLMAKSLGARVYKGAMKEIGWFPVHRTETGATVFQALPREFTPFHWHGDTFDLPAGATRLASTSVTPIQAFAFGSNALGLQFHFEATPSSVSALIEHAAHEIGDGPFEQATGLILATVDHYAPNHQHLFAVLDTLTSVQSQGN